MSLLRWQSAEAAEDENLLFVSASKRPADDAASPVLLSLANTSRSEAVTLSVKVGYTPRSVTGTVLSAAPAAPRRTDGRPCPQEPAGASVFRGTVVKGRVVEITVPATSVVVLTLQ